MTWIFGLGRWLLAWAIGAGVACVLGVAASAHFVADALAAVSGPIGLNDRMAMISADLSGFAPTYGALIGGAMLVSLALATLAARFAPGARIILCVLAGAVGVGGVVAGLHAVFGVPVLAGAREPLGLAAQGLAGAIGGLIFALIAGPAKKAT